MKNTIYFVNDERKLRRIVNELNALFGEDDRLFAVGKYLAQFPERGLSDVMRIAEIA